MKAILLLLLLLLSSCTTITPVCRHVVLAQYAAAIDAGYEAQIVRFLNTEEVCRATGYKWHVAVRIMEHGRWRWLEQQPTYYIVTDRQPSGTIVGVER